ncbi:MAG: RNA polymerase-binding protein DksA [Betaproteobacteria bacterium]|nr:RNA polymerase-binding protein DksA [Betaproteobacteria bacterium]
MHAHSARRYDVKAESGKAKAASAKTASSIKGKPVAAPVAKPATKVPVKSAPKATPAKKAPTPAKTPVKPAPKKSLPAKAAVAVKHVQAPVKVQPKESVKVTPDKVATAQVVAPVQISASVPSVPPRSGRPSSRLAQLTVPSMAQSVASTAAKASYTQTIPAPLIVPPLASAIKKDPKLANNWKTKPLAQLTDADLKAMPDDAYMNDVQLAYFRAKLVRLKLEIQSNAVDTTEHLREDTVVVPDPADRATIEEEHALELRTRDRERKLLKKIEQSIMRVDAGDYGYCDETGESIGVGRLLARPTATLSLEAQQRRELKQKMFGD